MRAAVAAALLSLLFQGCDQKKPRDIRVPDDEVTYIKPKAEAPKPKEKKAEPAKKAEPEEKPAEEKPAEEKPAEEKPAEEKPAEEKEAEEKEAEEKPAEEKAPDAALLAGPADLRSAFRSFLQTASAPVQSSFAQARQHGQSWNAVELEDASAQKRLQAMGNIIDADLNPDPSKVQSDIDRAWDTMQAEDRHFLLDQQHRLNKEEARAAYLQPGKQGKQKPSSKAPVHLLNVASRAPAPQESAPAPQEQLPTLD
jgi:hypothetical protein